MIYKEQETRDGIIFNLHIGRGSASQGTVKAVLRKGYWGYELCVEATALAYKEGDIRFGRIGNGISNVFLERKEAEQLVAKNRDFISNNLELRDVVLQASLFDINDKEKFNHECDIHLLPGSRFKCDKCGYETVCEEAFNVHDCKKFIEKDEE